MGVGTPCWNLSCGACPASSPASGPVMGETQQHPSQRTGGCDRHSEACSVLGRFLRRQSQKAKSKGFGSSAYQLSGPGQLHFPKPQFSHL